MTATDDPMFPERFTLNNGVQMPAIGLGTYRIRTEETVYQTIDSALGAGYRMFDTAAVYRNEALIKNAFEELLPKYNLQREDIFITTKLSPADHGEIQVVKAACKRSLDNLALEYIDLYLVHFPGAARIPGSDVRNIKLRQDTWAALTQLYDEGLVLSIGVCNFTLQHLKEIIKTSHVIPAINQVEWHPFYHDYEMLKFCKANDILLQAYCSLGGASHANNELLENKVVSNIAKKHNATCAQVLLVWALQQDIAIIPKSTHPERIKENKSLHFRLTESEIKALDKLGECKTKYAWDPNDVV